MKFIPIVLLVFFFLSSLHAQTHKLDSINNLITKATTDTGRINLLNVKANTYSENNFDSAISIATANIGKARAIHYLKGEADANRIAGSNLVLKGMFAAAKNHFAISENLYRQTADSNGLNKLYRSYGIYYGTRSMYDSSIYFFKKNAVYLEKTGKTKDLASAYQNIAVSYTMLSDFQQTILYQTKALKLAESLNDVSSLAYINLNMGIGYSNVSDYSKSEELFLKAIAYAKQAGIKNVELYAYANLASTYNQSKRYKEAYSYAMRAADLGKQVGDFPIVASSLARGGEALAQQKKFSEAEAMITTAMAIADTAGSPLNIYQTYSNMGFVKNEEQQYKEAIKYFEKGFAALKEGDLYDIQIGESYGLLAKAYEKTGAYQKALASFQLSTKIVDSIRSRDNVRKATEQSMNYDFDKKEEAQKATKEKDDRDNEIKLIFLIGFLLVFITLSTIALFAYKREQKAKASLNVQKKELESTITELKSTQAQLIQSEKMASLGELTAGIAHEIQNPLNFVNNFSEVNQELISELAKEIDKGNTEEVKAIAIDIKGNEEKINHHGKRADAIVKGMLQHSRKNAGQKEPTDINALCDEYLRLSYHGLRAKDKSFNAAFKTDFDEMIGKINIVPQDMGRVLLNLLNNAFYAVNDKKKLTDGSYEPSVFIQTKKLTDKVEIVVKDNGSGIPPNILDKIFQPFFTTKPTGQGTGLGLSLAYDIITKEHNGTIKVESKQNEGTTFIIQLPTA